MMAIPGVLMRMIHSQQPVIESSLAAPRLCSDIETIYKLKALDNLDPWLNTLYFVSDITPLVNSPDLYNKDIKVNETESTSISWVICAFINGRDSSSAPGTIFTEPHVLASDPKPNSVVIANGSTPRPDKEDDYHSWYDQEHGDKLRLVPGWNAARRYSLAKVYGKVETANFYGLNFYDEENGLGGPEWQAGVTEWTKRIRSNAAKPNIRRQWTFVGVEKP